MALSTADQNLEITRGNAQSPRRGAMKSECSGEAHWLTTEAGGLGTLGDRPAIAAAVVAA